MSEEGFLADLDISGALAKAASEAIGSGVSAAITDAAADAIPDYLLAATGEAAKVIIGELAGPVLRILLRAADRTSQKLDLVIREPFRTGTRVALEALEMAPLSTEDKKLQMDQFRLANDKLESAFSLARGKNESHSRFYIRMLQGLIARRRGALGYARKYFQDSLNFVAVERRELELLRVQEHDLALVIAGIPPATIRRAEEEFKTAQEWVASESLSYGIAGQAAVPWELKIVGDHAILKRRILRLAPVALVTALYEELASS